MARLTMKQLSNRRERLEDDALRGVERAVVRNVKNDGTFPCLNNEWVRGRIADAVIDAIERNHVISERRR